MNDNGNKATIREVFNLVEKTREELMGSILRLEGKFDILEAGRLSKLERDFAFLQGKMAIIAGVISVVISLIFLIINHYW